LLLEVEGGLTKEILTVVACLAKMLL